VWDELDEPLGFASGATAVSPVRPWRPAKRTAIGVTILAMVAGFLTLPPRDVAFNGEPFAVAKVEIAPALQRAQAPEGTASLRQTPAPPVASAEQMETPSGVKVTGGSGGPPKPLIIDVAQALGVKLAPAPDPRLIQKSKYGLLPRIGPDGARPIDVYARAALSGPRSRAGGPRIALVVGGFGLSAEGAESAITRLPGAITLAFAPTGAAVVQQAAQARAAGHETVLQTRLDEFLHSTKDVGASAPDALVSPDVDNLDSLRWQMGRFTGYVAVINDTGGKLMIDRQAISPILKEIADRGLGYLDAPPDGGAQDPQTMSPIPSARADLVIDANAAYEAVDASLSRLVGLARERGSAIGVVSVPGDIARLERWANGLDSKGVALVPLSALMAAPANPSAQANLSPRP
jgi:uncharacterized protein